MKFNKKWAFPTLLITVVTLLSFLRVATCTYANEDNNLNKVKISNDLKNSISLPSSCFDLLDGYYWLQLTENGIPIHGKCENGYLIIDIQHDLNIQTYFNSFKYYHYAIAGSDINDHCDWLHWFVKEKAHLKNKYQTSKNCNSCDFKDNIQFAKDQTSFYMNGNLFGWFEITLYILFFVYIFFFFCVGCCVLCQYFNTLRNFAIVLRIFFCRFSQNRKFGKKSWIE